jgi:hypothetical protein
MSVVFFSNLTKNLKYIIHSNNVSTTVKQTEIWWFGAELPNHELYLSACSPVLSVARKFSITLAI